MALLRNWISRTTLRLATWRQNHLSPMAFLSIAAAIIGITAGVASALLKWCLRLVREFIFGHLLINEANWYFILLPIVGILLATAFTRWVVRLPMSHGTERIIKDDVDNTNDFSPKLILGPVIGCSLTLGFGGSAGAEGPMAYTGAAIGSNVGKAFRVDPQGLSDLVGVGAAAGIAGIFIAPVGGVMFALEVLKKRQTLQTILTIILASLIAALTAYLLRGCRNDINFVPDVEFDLHLTPWLLLCGVACGIYSAYYSYIRNVGRKIFTHISNIWLKALVGGLILAVLIFFFPSLYGEGYGTLYDLMRDDPIDVVTYSPLYHLGHLHPALLGLMFALLLLKPCATSATNDSGGVAGRFTPTLFCGGIAGFLFAAVLNTYFGTHLPYAPFAFFGMAAVMSGAVFAPLMAIFICAEMTGLYSYILPLTLVSITSVLVTLALSRLKTKPLPILNFLHRHP